MDVLRKLDENQRSGSLSLYQNVEVIEISEHVRGVYMGGCACMFDFNNFLPLCLSVSLRTLS